MGGFSFQTFVEYLFPLPLLLLALLLLPFPRRVTRSIVTVANSVLGFPLVAGGIKLIYIMVLLMGVSLATSTQSMFRQSNEYHSLSADVLPQIRKESLGLKWRSERNFWLMTFGFTLWVVLARVVTIANRMVVAEDQLYQIKVSSGVASSVPPAPKKELKKTK